MKRWHRIALALGVVVLHASCAPSSSGASAGQGASSTRATGATPETRLGGTPLFGTTHTPHNLPISYWEPSILAHWGRTSIVDDLATADVQECIRNGCPNFTAPYVTFGDVAYPIYFARPGDPEHVAVDEGGSVRTCPLDGGKGWKGVRIPDGARFWDQAIVGPRSVRDLVPATDDVHFTIIDRERNRIYAFYTYAGQGFGLNASSQLQSSTRACDLLSADGVDGPGDDAIVSALAPERRYGCQGGAGYPSAGCGMSGIGAGISAGAPFGMTDSNGYLGPNGILFPQDFDDTGWTGDAIGTMHHALRCYISTAYQAGYMWPMQWPGDGTSGRSLRNGQIIRLDPSFPVDSTWPSYEQRLLRTLQVYGCVLSDYGSWGWGFHALSDWPGTGVSPAPDDGPWTEANMAASGMAPTAIAEAAAFHARTDSRGTRYDVMPHIAQVQPHLQVILPHGASYPAR